MFVSSIKGNFLLVLVITCFCLPASVFILQNYISFHQKNGIHYVCQTFNGRLANHIYQYASVYGIAKKHNFTIILGKDDDIVQYFELPSAEIRHSRKICEAFEVKLAKHCCVFDETFMNLPKNQSYLLGEYLQSWKYFSHVFNEVRKELKFKDRINDPIKSILSDYREAYTLKYAQNVTIVGVHIRRGDLASDDFSLGGVRPAPDEYIRHAIDYIYQEFKNIVFIVCSDDMEYAQVVMKYSKPPVEFVHNEPIHDLALLANCDHVITTVGSYGWWAGFLSQGIVLYYKYPMKEGTFERTEYNYDDFFPPNWIGLE
ncbi:Galactoside 2-alpha-L-fucosyltransferase 2-like [Mactra antiquata]